MSTTGKVLTVLVMLVAAVWVLLSAAVTELNRNGTKAVAELKKKVADLEVSVAKSARDIDVLLEQTHQEQLVTQNDMTTLQARISDLEKARTNWVETASRVKLQLADAESLVTQGE